MSTLRERITEAMQRHPDLTQAEIARACRVSTASVSDWLTGKTRSLGARSARLAAQLFGCDQNWLGQGVGLPNWTASSAGSALVAREVDAPPYAFNRTTPTLDAALPIVLRAIAELSPLRWSAVRAQLDQVASDHALVEEAIPEILRQLADGSTLQSKQDRAA